MPRRRKTPLPQTHKTAEPNAQVSPSVTETSGSNSPAKPFNPTPHDIHHTIFLLKTLLRLSVPHITSAIICFAEYHHRSVVCCTEERALSRHPPNTGAFVPYLTSTPVAGVGRRPLDKMVFTVKCRDERWLIELEPDLWTRWDAVAYKPRGEHIAESTGWDSRQQTDVEGFTLKELPRLYVSKPDTTKVKRWRVTVCLADIYSLDPERRRRAEWLQSLKQGDVVCLGTRHATLEIFPGYPHYAISAKIEMWTRYCL